MGTSLVPQEKLDLKAAKAQLEVELAFENFEEDPEIPEKREVKTPELALVEELKRDSDDENTKPLTREPKDVLSTGQEDAIIPESGDDVEVSSQAPNKEDVSKAYVTNTSQPKTRRRRRNDEDSTLESQTQAKQVRTKRDRQKSVVCVLIDSSQQDFVLPPKENTSSRKRNPSENASLVAETATHSLRKLRKKSTSEDELTSCNKKITTITVAPSLQPEDGSHHHLESIAEEDKNMVPHKALLNLNAEADEISSSPNPSNNRIRGRRVQLSVVLVENKDDRRIIEEKSVQATKEKGDPPTIKSDGDEIIPCTPASSKIRGRRTAKKANSELNPAVRLDSHGSVKQEVERNEGQVESSHEGDLQAETTIKNPTTAEEEPIDESVPSTPAPTKTRGRRQAIRAKSNNSLDRLTTNRTIEAVEFSEIRPEESIQKTKDVQDAVVQGGEGSETPKESANADIPHVAVEDISEVQYKDVEVCVATETVAETSAPTRKARRRKLSETVVEDHPTPNVAYSKKEDDGETRLENNTRPASRKTAVADSKAHKDESTNETETECLTLDQSSDVSSLVKVDSMAPKAIESQPKVEKSDVKTDVNLEEAVAPKARGRRLKLVENSTPQSSEVPKGRSRRAPLQTPESLTTNSIPKDDVKPIVDILSSGKAEEVVIEKSRGRRVKLDENPTPQLSEVPNGRGRRVVIKTDQKKSVSARKGNRRAALADESHEKEEQHSSENAFPMGETILCDEAAPRDDDVQQGERDSKNAIPWAHIEEATVVPTNAATECSSVNQSYAVEVDSTAPPPLTAVPIPGEDIKPMVDIPSSEDNAEKQVTEKSRSRRLKLVENSTPQSSEAPKGRMRRDALKTEPKENVPARKGSRRGARADTSHKEDSMIPYNEANQKDVDVETDLNSESVIPEDNPPPPGVELKTRGRRAPSRKGTRNGIVEQEIAVVRLTADTLKPRGQRAHLKDEDTVHHDIKAQREEVDSKEELSSKVAPSKTRGRKAAPKSELTEAVAIKSSPVSKTTRRGDEENFVEVHGTAEVDKIDEAVTSTPVPSKTRGRAGALKSEITGSTISMSVKKEEVSGDVNVNADSTPEEGNAQQKEDDIEEVVLSTPEPSKLRARRQVLTADPTKSKVLTPVRGRSRKAVVRDDPEVHTDVSEPIVSADASSHAMRKRGRKGAAEQETEHPIYDKPSRVETIEPTTENLSVGRRKGRRGATEQDPEIHTEDNDIEKVDQASTEHVTGGRKRGLQGAADHAIEIQTEDDDVEKEISKLSKHQAPIKSELIEAEPQDSDVHTDEVGSAVPRKKRRRVAAIKSEPTESAESSTPVRKRGRRGAAQEEESTATTKTEISDVDEVHSSSTKPSRARARQTKLKLESTAESIIPKNRRGNKANATEPANQGDAKKSEEESNDSTPTPSKPETSKPLRSRKASAKEISEEEEQPKNDVETKPIRGRRGAQKKDKPVDSTTSQTEEEHTSHIKITTARARKPNAKSEPEQSKPTRGRKPHTSEEVTVPTDDDIEQNTSTVDEEPTKKPTRGRKGLQVENIIAENSQPTSVTKKTTRGRQPATIDSDDENSSQIEAHTNPTRTRKVQQKNEENPAAAPKRTNRRNIEVVTEDEQSTPSKRIRRKPNKLLNDEFVI